MRPHLALVSGASGVVGRRLVSHLQEQGTWRVVGIARGRQSMPPGIDMLQLDLTQAAAVRAAAEHFVGATHVFHCARYTFAESTAEPIGPNLDMLRNLVEATESVSPRLQHVHLVHGSKYYGSDLGPYKTPAKESDARVLLSNWYYAQEDWIIERARGKRWAWSASRPHGICDTELGIVRSMARVIAVYATICNAGYDIMSDTTKLRRCGFLHTVDTEAMFLRLFDHFRCNRIIP